ncbi:hypothetical protein FLONG3_94 [Fusarium longipes]|uniref:Fido domain-containing protein n=1 Tax=Fusarium longipes TaxID=694270 RepID=A0A395TAN0_9HYPO|nr:hypothetical protein FLONG3_94 [Fusarium longipes]
MATTLPIVMDVDSYDNQVLQDLYDMFQTFASLLYERTIEGYSINFYFREKIYQLVSSSNMIDDVGEKDRAVTLDICHQIFEGFQVRELQYASDKSFLEVVHHVKAATYILSEIARGKDLSEDMILKTHRLLTWGIDTESTAWEDCSGKYRKCPVRSGFHQFMHEKKVPSAMRQMIGDYKADVTKAIENGGIDPMALAAKYCHIFVNIHPFASGNGRMSRLILNAILFKFTCCIVALGQDDIDRDIYEHIVEDARCREELRDILDLEDVPEEFQPRNWRSLANFTLKHALESMQEMHQLGQAFEDDSGMLYGLGLS